MVKIWLTFKGLVVLMTMAKVTGLRTMDCGARVCFSNGIKSFGLTTFNGTKLKAYSLQFRNVSDDLLAEVVEDISKLQNLFSVSVIESNFTIATMAEAFTAAGTTDIKVLTVKGCSIEMIPGHVLSNLTKLTHIILPGNNIRSIESYAFSNLPAVQFIKLSENRLERLPRAAFNVLPHLNVIDLSGNRLTFIDNFCLMSAPQLNIVHLDRNQLTVIPYTPLLAANVTFLYMVENMVTSIEANITGLYHLQALDLRGNRIEFVAPEMGQLKDLDEIHLSNNSLSSLDEALSDLFIRLDSADVANNPWVCDCHISWLIQWVQNNGVGEHFSAPKCHNPIIINMTDFNVQQLACDAENHPGHHVNNIVGLYVAAFCVATVALAIVFWRGRVTAKFHKLEMVVNGNYHSSRAVADTSLVAVPSCHGEDSTTEKFTSEDVEGFTDSKFRGKLNLGKMIGRGAFGEVYEGQVSGLADSWTKVAVKKLRETASEEEKSVLSQEFKQMVGVGKHPNIIHLLGSGVMNGALIIVMEFAPLGDLLSYLQNIGKLENYLGQEDMKGDVFGSHSELLLFAWHVTKGMDHLASMKVVHRDLAARNVLLVEGPVAKISDFGLSRDVYESEYCFQDSKGRLPYKWMSPETLLSGKFSLKSDVWSFGILLWETVTLGSAPYPGIPPDLLLELHKSGYRMEKPPLCPDNIYLIMRRCWCQTVEDRPTFAFLVEELDQVLQFGTQKPYLELQRENADHVFNTSVN